MTEFTKRVNSEIEKFQKEMDKYGLTVSRSFGGHYANEELTEFCARLETKSSMKRGKKGIIDVLKSSGYAVAEYMREDKERNRFFVFTVYKTVVIPCGSEGQRE